MLEQNLLNTRKNRRGLGTLGAGSDIQIIVGGREIELFKENFVHGIGIMLSGMKHREFKTLIGTFTDNGRHFNNFRARANDNENHANLRESGIPGIHPFFYTIINWDIYFYFYFYIVFFI